MRFVNVGAVSAALKARVPFNYALAVLAVVGWHSPAMAQGDFGACDARIFITQNREIYSIDTSVNPFTFNAFGLSTFRVNGADFRASDKFVYGMRIEPDDSQNHLFKMGSDGEGFDQGPVAGLPLPSVGNYNSGAFSPDGGTLYVSSANFRRDAIFAIDVDGLTADTIQLNQPVDGVDDWAMVNGALYGVDDSGNLVRVDFGSPVGGKVTSGTVQVVGSTRLGRVDMGGMMGAPNGVFGIANSGGFYQLDTATGAATLLSASAISSSNDGIHCSAAKIALGAELSITNTNTPGDGEVDLPEDGYGAGVERTYTVTVANRGPFGAQNQLVANALPAGVTTARWTCSGRNGGVCGAGSGTGAINDPGADLPVGASVVYLLTIAVPADYSGNLTSTATVTPGDTIVGDDPANNSATDTDFPLPTVTVIKRSLGGIGTFGFFGTNGFADQNITTLVPGTPVAGATQTLAEFSTETVITETLPAGDYDLADLNCAGLGSGTATVDRAGRKVTLDAAAVRPGAQIVCTFTNTLQPTLAFTKRWVAGVPGDKALLVATGGTGAEPPQLDSIVNAANETDTGTPVGVVVGDILNLAELLPTANLGVYTPGSWSCTGGSLAGAALTLRETDAGTDIVCTLVNTREIDLSVVKTASPSRATSGQLVTYAIVAVNHGPNAGDGAILTDVPDPALDCAEPQPIIDCIGTNGAICASPTVALQALTGAGVVIPTFPVNGRITLTMRCTVKASGFVLPAP